MRKPGTLNISEQVHTVQGSAQAHVLAALSQCISANFAFIFLEEEDVQNIHRSSCSQGILRGDLCNINRGKLIETNNPSKDAYLCPSESIVRPLHAANALQKLLHANNQNSFSLTSKPLGHEYSSKAHGAPLFDCLALVQLFPHAR